MPAALWFWEFPPTAMRWNSEDDADSIARSFDEREGPDASPAPPTHHTRESRNG
jgi:hypothetical protein